MTVATAGMDFELPQELRLLKENVRRFVDRELIPLEREVVNDVKMQKELPNRLRGKGAWARTGRRAPARVEGIR